MGVRLEDRAGSSKEFRRCLGNGPRSCRGREAPGLVRIGIEAKEGLSDLGGLGLMIRSMPAHLTFAVAAHAMGIDGQACAAERPRSASEQSQRDWQRVRFSDGVSPQELLNRPIAHDTRQSIEPCKTFLAQGALRAYPGHAQRRLVDQWERHPWLQTWGGVTSPTAQAIPGPSPYVFGDKEPKSDHGPTHLVGEELSYAAFEASWVARFWCCPLCGAMGFDGRFRLRMIAVQVFFAGQSLRSHARHFAC